jgi:peptidoglycan hydrolase CwlO-like protein
MLNQHKSELDDHEERITELESEVEYLEERITNTSEDIHTNYLDITV